MRLWREGLKGVTLLDKRTPADAVKWQKTIGNRFNAIASQESFLEVLQEIPVIEKSWKMERKKLRETNKRKATETPEELVGESIEARSARLSALAPAPSHPHSHVLHPGPRAPPLIALLQKQGAHALSELTNSRAAFVLRLQLCARLAGPVPAAGAVWWGTRPATSSSSASTGQGPFQVSLPMTQL